MEVSQKYNYLCCAQKKNNSVIIRPQTIMKTSLFTSGEYDSPNVTRIDIAVERGFASSINELPDDYDGIFGNEF